MSFDTSVRPTASSPSYVRAAESRRLCLAASLCVGESVLDVGAGEGKLFAHIMEWVYFYTALDTHKGLPWHDSRVTQIEGDVFEELSKMQAVGRLFNTVVALEVIEHLDPARQEEFLRLLWAVTADRLIVSTPEPTALTHYPRTDHFLSYRNPNHTREVDEWWFRDVVGRTCDNVKAITTLGQGLDRYDWPVWLQGPTAYWMGVVDRA